MSNSQINNLASEIVLAKTAASAATAKVTRLLNDVYTIKSFNLDASNNIFNLNNQVNNINQLLNNLSLNDGSFVTIDQLSDISNVLDVLLNYQNIQDNSFQEIYNDFFDISNILYSTINNFNQNFNNIDSSFQLFDTSLTQLVQNVKDICGTEFIEKIRNISGDVIQLESLITTISGEVSNLVDTVHSLDVSYVTDLSFSDMAINIDSNLSFLSGQDVLLKNDVNYNTSLIDNNNTYIQRLESKLINLVNILNSETNLNININTL